MKIKALVLRFLCLCAVLLFFSCSPEEIRIGYLAGLSGPFSQMGNEGRKALDMAVAELNVRGGVQGHPVRLIAADDFNDPLKALEALKSLEKQKVSLVIGPMTSGVMNDILPYMNEHKIPFISPTVSSSKYAKLNDYFYRVVTLNNQMGDLLAQLVVQKKIHRIAVLLETSNENYTRIIFENFLKGAVAQGVQVLPPLEYDMRKDKDHTFLAKSLIQGNPEAFLLLTNGFDTASFSQQLAKMGQLQPIFVSPWAMTRELVELGGKQTSRIHLVGVFDPGSQQVSYMDFERKYKALYNEDPDFPAVYSWDALSLAVHALELSKSRKGEDLKTALDETKTLQGLQSTLVFDAYGDVYRELFLLQIKDGRFVRMNR